MDTGTPRFSVGIVCASVSRQAGGILPIMQAHARELSRRGVEVAVHGIADDQFEAERASWTPAQLHVHHPRWKLFAYAPALGCALSDASHDLLHQHGLWLYPSIAVSRWRLRTGRPVVVSTQGMLEPWALANAGRKKSVAARLFERANLEGAACIHCSEVEVAGVRAFGLTNPIAVIPNGADLPAARGPCDRPLWLPEDGRRTLLFLGRLHPKKGIRETLDAWAILGRRHPAMAKSWRLVIAGWDDCGHAVDCLAHARAVGLDDVLFPGPLFGEAKEAALAHADAFILASYSEGLPMAVLEAWAHALPVFMTRGCNLPDGFAMGAAIEISTEPAEIAGVLAYSLARGNLRAIGARGRELVANQFSWPQIATDLHAVYAWLACRGPRPNCILLD